MTNIKENEWKFADEDLKEYVIEVGTPLQRAIVDNFEAQKQLYDLVIQVKNDKLKTLLEKVEGEQKKNSNQVSYSFDAGYNSALTDISKIIKTLIGE